MSWVVTKRMPNVASNNDPQVALIDVAHSGAYTALANGGEAIDLTPGGIMDPLDNFQLLEGELIGGTSSWRAVYQKGTSWANGILRLFTGGAEVANTTVVAASGTLKLYLGRRVG